MDHRRTECWDDIDQAALKRLAYSILGSREAAEDVVQDALAKYVSKYILGKKTMPGQAWLMSITRNAAIDRYRRQQAERRLLDGGNLFPFEAMEQNPDTPEENHMRSQLRKRLVALLLLNASERDVVLVLLRDVFELDFKQLAGLAGMTESNCRQLLGRIRKRVSISTSADNLADCVCKAANPLFEQALIEQRIDPLLDYLNTLSAKAQLAALPPEADLVLSLTTVYRRGRISFELRLNECLLCPLPSSSRGTNRRVSCKP